MKSSADELQLDRFRRMSPSEKLALAAALRQTNLDLLAAGIRTGRGELAHAELRLEMLRRILPEPLFRAAYGLH